MSRPRRARANAATAPPAALPAELPDELWALMFAIDDEVAASCYSLNRQLNALANQSLLSRAVLPPRVRRLTEQETCVMADLIETLALSADNVKRGATYTTRRRFGGGHYNIFDPPAAVRSLLEQNGGLLGFQERIAARRKRAANREKNKPQRDAARAARQAQAAAREADRQSQLEKGFEVIGLSLRDDSEMCDQFIEHGTKEHSLLEVMETMARMKYIHEYTDYQDVLEREVEAEGEESGFYDGIWRQTAEEVQCYSEFQLPKKLPWLGDKFKSTGDAIRAAVDAAHAEEVAQRPRKELKGSSVRKRQRAEGSKVVKKRKADAERERGIEMIATASARAAKQAAEQVVNAIDMTDEKKKGLLEIMLNIATEVATGATEGLKAKLDKLPTSAYKALAK